MALCAWLRSTAAVVALLFAAVQAGKSSKPNILFVVADDLGYDDIDMWNNNHSVR